MEPSRLEELRSSVASRLRHVCANWPEEQFAALVESIAALTIKYELRGNSFVSSRASHAVQKRLAEGLQKSEAARTLPRGLAQGMGSIPHAPHQNAVPPRIRSTPKPDPDGS
jgi:hypothetical protein